MPKRQLQGTVVSNKMQKTIVVEVERVKEHPKYKKRYRVSKKYKAHDSEQKAKAGDFVLLEECRPLSKDKNWKLIKIIKKYSDPGKDDVAFPGKDDAALGDGSEEQL